MTPHHPRLDPAIAQHYRGGRERDRLLAGAGRLEFLRTREVLARHLPPPPAEILDVGGGAGVHALPLAADGHAVTLVDPVALHVEQARAASAAQAHAPAEPASDRRQRGVDRGSATRGRGLAGAELGDARQLSRPDASADAVLLLGPLYHLTEREERLAALREARRVVRPGGLVAAAAISRFAPVIDGLVRDWVGDPDFEALMVRDLADGQHRNPTNHPAWFTTAFFHHPDELADEVRAAGLSLHAVVAVEGLGWRLDDLDARLDDPANCDALLRTLRRVETEPSLLGASPHLLAIAHRPAGGVGR